MFDFESNIVDLYFDKSPSIAWRLIFTEDYVLLLPVNTLAVMEVKDTNVTGKLKLKWSTPKETKYIGYLTTHHPVTVKINKDRFAKVIIYHDKLSTKSFLFHKFPLYTTLCRIK